MNRKQIYVECKAYRETLGANILTNLLGTITLKEYQEGWLISTGNLGKDAKGFQHEWESKPAAESQKISIYTPERVIEALVNAGIVKPTPYDSAIDVVQDQDLLGEWMLLITSYGKHWIISCLEGGIPAGVLIFSATTGKLIEDNNLLLNLSATDTSLSSLDFKFVYNFTKKSTSSLRNED